MLSANEQIFLESLYRRYAMGLQLFSYSLLDRRKENWPLAEDCVQLTFEKAMLKIQILQEHESPYLWLRRTCHNITVSERRKQYNRARILHFPVPVDMADSVADPQNGIAEWIIREELLEMKQELLLSLSEQESRVYKTIYQDGETIADTARHLNLTNDAVRGTLERIRRKKQRSRS